jgi:hypothetical protein
MAINQDYYGYIPSKERLDLGKLTSDLANTISGIGQRRELEKEQLDQIKTDNIKTIQEMDFGKSQTFQKMALNGTQSAVDLINTWNKDLKAGILSPKDYKEKMNSIQENWGTFANTVKNYDARMAEIQKQQADGTASGMAVDLNEFFAQSAELKDKQIFWDPSTGSMSLGKIDPNTGKLDPQSVMSARSMSMPNNILFDKVNLNEQVGSIVKDWAPFLEEENINTISDVRNNDDFAGKVTDLVGALTDNPRMAASILRDNTGGKYVAYVNQADYNNKMNSMIKKENDTRGFQGKEPMTAEEQAEFAKEASNRLIEMRLDSTDTYQPVLTPAQMKAAEDAVIRTIGIYLERKSTQDEVSSPSRNTSSNSSNNTNNNTKYDSKTMDEIRSIVASPDWSRLQSYSVGGKYTFKSGPNQTINVYQKNARGEDELVTNTTFYNAGQFFKGFSNPDEWKKYVDYSQGKGKGNTDKFNG